MTKYMRPAGRRRSTWRREGGEARKGRRKDIVRSVGGTNIEGVEE